MSTYWRTARGVNRRQTLLSPQKEDTRTEAIQENFKHRNKQPEKQSDRKQYRGKQPQSAAADKSQE